MNVLQVDIVLHFVTQLGSRGEGGIGNWHCQQSVDHLRSLSVRGSFSQPLRRLEGIFNFGIVDHTVLPCFAAMLNVFVVRPATGTNAVAEL